MSSAARAGDEDLAHARRRAVACSASATTSRPTPREALTSTVSPGATSAGHERGGRRGVGDRMRVAAERPAMCAARGPTVTSTSTPRSRACAPISSWKRRSSGPSSSMSPSTATRRPAAVAASSSSAARIDIGLAL